MSTPTRDELHALLHALREPVSAFVVHLALLDDADVRDVRPQLEAMRANVQRMTEALAEITARFGLETGGSTPPILHQKRVDKSVPNAPR